MVADLSLDVKMLKGFEQPKVVDPGAKKEIAAEILQQDYNVSERRAKGH